MAFEELKAGIYMILDEIEKSPEDRLELEEQLREKLAELKSLGLPLPEDLVKLEEYLESSLAAGGAGGGSPQDAGGQGGGTSPSGEESGESGEEGRGLRAEG